MKWLGFAWTVLLNLVGVVLVVAMFGVARSPFETVVVSGVILTYFAVTNGIASLARLQSNLALALSASFIHVLKRVNDPRAGQEEQQLREATEQMRAATVRFYVNGAFSSVVFLVVIIKLVAAVL